ncbi:MAG: hypothetical protein LBM77_13845, partial [Spirochaetaceae bacterium]|nr:hypothetical protein [Spirochaetaceae bacterium]
YKLSELFIELTGEPKLELEVTVLNVNEGHNREIMSRSETLKEYSAFVDVVRHYRNESEDLEQAMKQALGYCITHGILPEYLKEHGSEVISMLTLEWNTEDAKVVWREEGRQEGLQQGLQQGVQQGVQQGLQQGIAQARSIGIPEDTIVKIFGHN